MAERFNTDSRNLSLIRFKEFLKRGAGVNPGASNAGLAPARGATMAPIPAARGQNPSSDAVEYYNDLPGKRPPPEPVTTANNGGFQRHKKGAL